MQGKNIFFIIFFYFISGDFVRVDRKSIKNGIFLRTLADRHEQKNEDNDKHNKKPHRFLIRVPQPA